MVVGTFKLNYEESMAMTPFFSQQGMPMLIGNFSAAWRL
ncbi:hypothetical protein SLEP1_g15826 [Rubroshorea leprosula]|uniref:Uncharacterized protein n=1 Tax=Rubroshorea leprosula TaxID=152421 RepID=A0AAV5INQ3_9ROSI|nr:hypothetical protein SLEP1_g15826 [Rubroshorea leprosula]